MTGSGKPGARNRYFQAKISVSADAISQGVGGETVILDLKSDRYFGLDSTGARIWELLQQGEDPEGILNIITSEFDVGPETLKPDLEEHLQSLEEAGLIKVIF